MSQTFAERFGFKEPRPIQVAGMDRRLRIGLWNAVDCYLHRIRQTSRRGRYEDQLQYLIWTKFLKHTADSQPTSLPHEEEPGFWEEISRWYFAEGTDWAEVYGFVEFLAENGPYSDYLAEGVNEELQEENAGYRLVGCRFVPITNETELDAVRQAATARTTALKPVSIHIHKALELLSDRKSPDYRNSMKESICAVESLCKLITGMETATLGPALDKVAKDLDLNDHLRNGFKEIYVYTSDDHGIRHGLKSVEHPEQEDARFMAITCSAFVNYVTEKARKLNKLPT